MVCDALKVKMFASAGQVVPASTSAPYMENDRLYHGYHRGVYMYPCDEVEKDRMDLFHQMFLIARRQELHRASVESTQDVRILDVGTGTGIWAIDMADMFPNAEVSDGAMVRDILVLIAGVKVVGIDLENIQPERIPPNLRFRVPRDYEGIWTMGENSYDLIHLRQACGSVQSWPELYQKIFLHLKPGCGKIEQVEIDLRPRCDDGTLPYAPVVEWYDYLKDATQRASRPIEYQHNTRQMLEAAGFIDIQEQVIRAPYNAWPSDPHQKDIGRWYSVGLAEWVEALSLGPLTRVYQWSAADVKKLTTAVRQAIKRKETCHGYNNIHIWTARRPQQ